ncbi:Transcriptional regulator, MarR family [Actinokineospora spheciospongiae]|uniref:Transcriptional regulator, MarR family n=1 Tax=Actinokineospora spheciospongiae TaxID=909613 RepID=W7IPL6_9PSEU|nr:hypothetical protein [Actinokineospora spheciospongiae]EWC62343.1 Transcriptional regulator, MarR family [Actinokineospora spheciospongiae]
MPGPFRSRGHRRAQAGIGVSAAAMARLADAVPAERLPGLLADLDRLSAAFNG